MGLSNAESGNARRSAGDPAKHSLRSARDCGFGRVQICPQPVKWLSASSVASPPSRILENKEAILLALLRQGYEHWWR